MPGGTWWSRGRVLSRVPAAGRKSSAPALRGFGPRFSTRTPHTAPPVRVSVVTVVALTPGTSSCQRASPSRRPEAQTPWRGALSCSFWQGRGRRRPPEHDPKHDPADVGVGLCFGPPPAAPRSLFTAKRSWRGSSWHPTAGRGQAPALPAAPTGTHWCFLRTYWCFWGLVGIF